MPLQVGARLGAYEILSPLGAGGMGEVYRARDSRLGRDIAIKVLPEDVARDPDRLARFEREARSLAALNHPGIVTIFAVEESEGGARFLAMELVEGESLDTLISPGGLPLARFLEIAVPLAEALSAAHERGIVHRDLKPGNVMVTREGRVKVLDFGLARVEAADSNADLTSTPTESRVTNLTSEGQVFGTVAYMSPEQARGARVDARSDVFSLGIVIYQMLTGDRPFHGATAVDLISSILRDRPASITDLRADLPPDLAKVVRRCLEKEPRDRYQTSRDVYNELRELRSEIGSGASAGPPPQPRRERTAPSSGSGLVRAEIPWIAVLPFQGPAADAEIEAFADGLAEDITTGLSRFRYLSVVSRASTARLEGKTGDVRTVAAKLGARYVVEGSVRRSGASIRVSGRLIEAAAGTQLWASTYDRDLQATGIFDVQDDVAARIVATVADSYGVLVRSLTAALEQKADGELSSSEWLFQYFAYRQLLTPPAHAALKRRLELAVERDSRQSDLWACLALVHTDEYAFGFGADAATLERALAAARRAVELDRTNSFALLALAQAHFFRQELAAFHPAAEQAMALNPLNTDALGILGLMIVHTAEFRRGAAIVRRAMELNPSHAGWFHFGPIWEHFERGEYERALGHAMQVNMPGLFWQPLVIAAISGQLGRPAEGAAAVRDLLALDPDFGKHARRDIGVWHFASGLLDRILDGVRNAGLEIAEERAHEEPSPSASGETRTAEGFWVAVLPFRFTGTDAGIAALAEGLTEDVATGLSRFPHLEVIGRGSTARYAGQAVDVRSAGRQLGARYVMEGSVRPSANRLRVAVQLVDASNGAHLWAETYDRDVQASDALALQDDLTDRIVATVADTSGALIRSMAASVEEKPDEALTASDVVLRHWRYQHRGTPAEHARVRDGLEKFVEREPGHADVWACLARLYVHEFALGFNPRPDPLGRALRAAQRAVDLDPTCQHARAGIAQVHFFRREVPAFRAAAEQAIALNPRDTDTLGVMGNMLTDSGDFERGPNLVRRAMELNPHSPDWFRFALTVEHFQKADYAGALEELARVNMPGFFWKPLWVAACAGLDGRPAEAATAVEELRRIHPDIEGYAREYAPAWLYASGLTERFLEGLRKAGLEIPGEGGPATSTSERAASSPPSSGAARADIQPPAAAPVAQASAAASGPRTRRPWIAGAAAAILLVMAAVWIARSRSAPARPPEAATSPQAIRSLAVLPLDNYSGDPSQDYFAEGMTDELTSQLANISRLRVISRGSAMQFKGKSRPPTPEIAKRLDVDAVVEGSVIRSGDKVRITAQLIDARSDRHLWAKSFERSSKDVLALQDELASAIAREIHVTLTPEEESRLAKAPSVDPQAYDAYLKGRYFFNRPSDENLGKAIAQFEEVNRLDPTFAPAFSGLSDAYLWAGYNEGVIPNAEGGPKAKAAAEEAIRLDDASAEAHASLATYLGWYAHDWSGSEAAYRRAFARNPNYSFAHDQFGILLALQGRLDEAIAEGKRAAELDPLSPQIPVDATMAYAFRGDHEAARKLARKGAELDPTFFFPAFMEAWIDLQAGRVQDAIPLFEKAKGLEAPPFVTAWLGYARGVSGDRAGAMAALDALKTASLKGYVPPFNLALVHLGLGDRERALDFLEQAYANNSQWMPYLRGDRTFDPLRSDPRFQALMKKLNFEK